MVDRYDVFRAAVAMVLLLTASTNPSMAQSGWTMLSPQPVLGGIGDFSFTDTNNGIAVTGALAGAILVTSDGGSTWTIRDIGGEDMMATFCGDLVDCLKSQDFRPDTSPADKLILRASAADDKIESLIKWLVSEEESRGVWKTYYDLSEL